MSETLILIRLEFQDAGQFGIDKLFHRDAAFFESQPGFRSAGLWRSVPDPKSNLILLVFESDAAAQQAILGMAELRAFTAPDLAGLLPVDVLVFRINRSEGALRGHFESADFLSLSLRVSEPGYSDELSDDLDRVFSGLRFIEGYVGSLIARNRALEEEVLGIVAWQTEAAFTASLPRTSPYEVRLYRRIA